MFYFNIFIYYIKSACSRSSVIFYSLVIALSVKLGLVGNFNFFHVFLK